MSSVQYHALGPLQAGEGSRAFLGLEVNADQHASPVVIVWVPEAAENDPQLISKMRHETEHAARLEHPNIVRVAGFAQLDEGYARIVEYADGESLRRILDAAKKLPLRIATRIIADVCVGTHFAHIAGNDDGLPLVHGDLRPETMLIGFNGVTKVTGYGALAFAPREHGGKRVLGRRIHSAPEQIISGRESISIATDVYLIGIALYECLTGAVPWAEQGDFFDHAVLTLPLPPATPGEIPNALWQVIERACSKKALERHPTPFAFKEAMEAVVGSEMASAAEVAHYLEAMLPGSSEVRAARRQTIDAGIADFIRRHWATQKTPAPFPATIAQELRATTPGLRPQPQAVNVAAPVTTPATVSPLAPPLNVAPLRVEQPAETERMPTYQPPRADRYDDQTDIHHAPRAKTSLFPFLVGGGVVLVLGAIVWSFQKANEPIARPRAEPPPKVAALPPPEIPMAPPVAPVAPPVAPVVEKVVVAPPAPAVPAAPVQPSMVNVNITCEPPVELTLDGSVLGRTPWSGKLPPGRKVFKLSDKGNNISTTRTLNVKGESVSETFQVGKGAVGVQAPAGSMVFIDGNRIGAAPITGDIPVYEGSHKITVTFAKAKWGQPFSLRSKERMDFNVEFDN